ncbi:DUF4198 domain-containing protein [Maribius pontilimi]|uniref:DUF4198 domain-containing protein n=1 Tax=Palleronia pontilimi TaxID=1964209 RepID=A0A934MCF2_9RHOB|nr:DUF4198 domain-containing protein [Palleronia pontilimi]MBJ3762723.1 DUF4198 domain-containing protein [Palleronia pontilimi]
MSRASFAAILAFGALSTGAAESHEFWIEPVLYQTEPGFRIIAAIRVGQAFEGSSYAYLPDNFLRFDLEQGGEMAPVDGRPGDRPAVNLEATREGLAILVHVTRDYELEYDSYEDFVSFVESKDAAWVLGSHADRGLPEEGPVEAYSRYGKSLIAVGDGAGQDHSFGLLTEIVALENPYTDDMSDGLDVQVLYEGEPRGDAQVEVFAKDAEGTVEITKLMTDKSGLVTVPVEPGKSYLVDSVLLREPKPEAVESMGAVWESLWASLTFAIPEGT